MFSNGQARDRRSSKPYQLLGADPLTNDKDKTDAHSSSLQLRFISSANWIFILFVFALVIAGTQHLHKCVPRPLPPNEENDRFSEIRGRPILDKLSAIGPKPSGSVACEKEAVDTIVNELETIKKKAEDSHHTLTIEKQYPSGCFDIPRFDVDGFALCYKNVSNIIARLGRKDRPWHKSHTSVLLNCHYDSWPTSYGGSDDLVSCALMMEILRVLTDPRSKPVRHDVIFLFNGAEESSLLAAHGFITKHPYRHGIKAFINLEASGSGGRELLFQAGPGNQWLLNSYLEAAPHPHCSILGQEVFQSGVYPGDTDFRVFRDYGRIPGLDLAFVQNGYWYHTEFDKAEMITSGSMQRAGENILATLRHLLESPYLDNPAEYGDRKFVFFDVVGLFSVVYPMKLGEAINIVCAAIVFYTVFRKIRCFQKGDVIGNYSFGHFTEGLISHTCSAFFIVICVFLLAHLVNMSDMTMTWYVKQWTIVPLYGWSTFLAGMVGQTVVSRLLSHKSDAKFMEHALHDAHMTILSVVLVGLTYKGIASAFLLTLLILFPLLRNTMIHVLQKILMLESAILFCAMHLICILPGLVMAIYTSELLISIFVPIMGRNSGNPEIIIASFCAFSSFFISMALASLLPRTKTRSLRKIFILGFLIWIAFFAILNLKQMKASYDYKPEYPSARRTQFFHMRRKIFGKEGQLDSSDNGLVAIAQDYRGVSDIPSRENILATLRHLLESPYLDNPAEYGDRKFVFFDVVGLFSVVYPMKLGEAINIVCAAIVFYTVFRKIRCFQKGDVIGNYSFGHFTEGLISHTCSAFFIVICVFLLAHLVNMSDMTMTWYVKQWTIVPLYGWSTFLAGMVGQTVVSRLLSHKSDAKFMEHALHDAHMTILSVVLVGLTYKGIASAFLLTLLILFPLLRNTMIHVLQKILMLESAILFCAMHLICILPGLVMAIYTSELLISIFVPIMGRNSGNPEIIIASFCAFSSFFISMALASLLPRTKTRSLRKIFILGFLIWIAFFAILNLKQMKASYDYKPEYPSARRTQFFHMRRKIFGKEGQLDSSDNGLVAIAQDYRGVSDIPFVGQNDSGYEQIECRTNSKFCELPYYYPTAHRINDRMIRFKPVSEELSPKHPINVTMQGKVYDGDRIRYNYTVTGSEQISVYATSQGDYSIKSWSVFQNQDEADSDNSAFAFLHCSGEDCGHWEFEIVLERKEDFTDDAEGHELLLCAVAHYLHGPDMRSETLSGLLKRIQDERADPAKWKWAMTASAWNADVISKYY
ncbi:hypothetical protein QR680_000766 [Steinernema hermaphroditum]|uniref:FXNA-like protease n=1 Tax=Steinernema hermaphroditum TaxID=289476 RepID=A0AA39GWI7_9BILA|nr:hypothetical protein QR680_000766 [Steinernema hermaphroditum]